MGIVQVIGALVVLGALAAARLWLGTSSRLYLLLDLVGSSVLTALAWHHQQ